jgi:hypothetical protein
MGSYSVWHWLIVLFWLAVTTLPFIRILPRAGISSWVAVLGIIPFMPVVLLWVLALKRWPGDSTA